MKLFLGDKFWDSFINLPKNIQKQVVDFQDKFRKNSRSTAIHLEPIVTFKDQNLRTARVTQKYRAIVGVAADEKYYLLWVDNHDEAMDWAKNKIFQWNEMTNSPQIFSIDERESNPKEAAKTYQYEPKFRQYSKEDLLAIGVPELLMSSMQDIDTLEDLEKLEDNLPDIAFENLFDLFDGKKIDLIKYEVEENSKLNEEGESLNARRHFISVDDEVLEQMLEGSLEKWHIFLHPSQRKLVNRDFKSSVKVTGGAGTGKTVAAIHRLKYLSEKRPNKKILFSTFTNALKKNLSHTVKRIGIKEQYYELSTIDALVSELAVKFKLIKSDTKILGFYHSLSSRAFWEEILNDELSTFDANFLDAETQEVLFYHNIQSKRAYFKQPRIGRSKAISRKAKVEIWQLFGAYQEQKKG